MKFCVDCKHYRFCPEGNVPEETHRCSRGSPVNMVTGKLFALLSAMDERLTASDRTCGPEGKFFEPKPEPQWPERN